MSKTPTSKFTPPEDSVQDYELADPIGDEAHEVAPGLIHRYPDRALLLVTNQCYIRCRFCFRKERLRKKNNFDLPQTATYLQQHPQIQEIIFSGGDPLTLTLQEWETIYTALIKIKHVKIWRIHTRIPIVNPGAVSQSYLSFLKKISQNKKLVIVLHVNHPRELTPVNQKLINQLLELKIMLLSQGVLLKGVNDDPQVLTTLFRQLVLSGIKPYYLHHLDKAPGTHQFRVSVEEGKKIYQSLRGNLSGICIPEYVLDLPGGYGKVPVMWLEKISHKKYKATNFRGEKIVYIDL